MKKKELKKRFFAMGMATMMAFASSGKLVLAEPSDEDEVIIENEVEAFNFEDADTELYVGSDWAGANANLLEDGTKAVIDASSFGWNGEWGLQYIIKSLGLSDYSTYTIEFDITSTADKNILLKLDDNGFLVNNISLYANEKRHISTTVECGSFSEKPYLFFALGQMSGEAANISGKITIENLVFSEGEAQEDDNDDSYKKGPEYDFSVDNSEYDYADPGKTKNDYDLIWADEFDGNYGNANVDADTGLNLDNWACQLGDGSTDCGNYGWGNNELQCYTDRVENLGVNEDLNGDGNGEGVLRITAKRENGYIYAGESAKNYTSARLRSTKPTKELFNTTYGYIESRIALPATAGAWPAFWMLPQSTTVYGNWPVSGEIDILETCGAFSDKGNDVACGTLHWGTPTHVYKGSGYVNLDSDYTYFHTYAIDWEPGQITWYYDGKAINTLTNWESAIPGASDSLSFDAPFDMPFYMLLNLAVDSGQFGGGVNKAKFEDDINMYVDYVRVYQRTEGYAEAVSRQASGNANADWEQYKGINQIADIREENLDNTGGGLSDSTSDINTWYLSNQDDAKDATLDKFVDNDGKIWAKVGVKTPGSQNYSVQLIGHYNAKAGYVYKVSYDAYADGAIVGQSVDCDSKEWKGWSTYGVQQFKLTDKPSHYSYTFQQEDDFDNCRIEFNLGSKAAGNVYISNVKVEIVDPATIGNTESSRAPLADGNMVYNGTFDQGNYHTGNWKTTKGTKLNVPRYTTEALKANDLSVIDVASKTNYEGIEDGKKYFERRAIISAEGNNAPAIFQPEIKMTKDTYTVKFDLYSEDDTAVKVSANTYSYNNDSLVLGKELGAATARYNKKDCVRTYTLAFDTKQDADEAALVFTFAKGANIQLDNVYMNGQNQASAVEEHPLKANASYRGDNGGGVEIPTIYDDGVITMSGITSGGNWYSPQLASADFELVAGHKYKLSFDYKLSGANNGTFQYIIQENGGSWHVYDGNGPTTVEKTTKSDGFTHYEREFIADATISAVHLNYGFGNSDATGDMAFSFKNAKIDLVKQSASSPDELDNEDVDDKEFGVNPIPPSRPSNSQAPSNNSSSNSTSSNGGNSNSGNNKAPETTITETKTPLAGANVGESLNTVDSKKSSSSKKIASANESVAIEEETEDIPVEEEVQEEDEEMTIQITSSEDSENSDVQIEDDQTPLDGTEISNSNKIPFIVAAIIIAIAAIGGVFGIKIFNRK